MMTFEEWITGNTPDGHPIRDEILILYNKIEHFLHAFRGQIDKPRLFHELCRKIYEESTH